MTDFKKCFVPCCGNTTVKTLKKFMSLPHNSEIRRKWCIAVGRLDLVKSTSRAIYCCEDHFDMEKDCENWMVHKFVKASIRMKRDIVPHKCLVDKSDVPKKYSISTFSPRKKTLQSTEASTSKITKLASPQTLFLQGMNISQQLSSTPTFTIAAPPKLFNVNIAESPSKTFEEDVESLHLQTQEKDVHNKETPANLNKETKTSPRNPYLAKWDILFDKKVAEWISFKPQLGLHVYPCYACRDMFGSKNSFLDHVNRRGMLLKYKCSFCVQSDELIFYNPCSFLLHTRQHYTLLGGQINLEKLEVAILPFGLAGFLPDPNVPLLYNVEDDNIGETSYINTRFYSPVQESMGQPIINLVPNELLFFFSPEPNSPSTSLVLKQVSSNIPRCQFVTLDNNRFAPIPLGLDINGRELQSSESNNSTLPLNGFHIKEEPQEITDDNSFQYDGPIITKIETIDESVDETPVASRPSTRNIDNFPHCPECGQAQTVSMGEHFLKTNKPFQESLKCSICKYIAPTKCSLQAHERIHESIAPYVCPECGKDFDDWKLLHAHLEEVCFHLTKQVRLRCPGKKCGKIFAQVITFSAHFLAHMQCLSKCTICNDIFLDDIDYLEHAEIHDAKMLPIKVYKCSVCIDSYFTDKNYQDHIHEHATNKKQCLYVYICKHCHSYFRSTVTYATHLLRCSKLAASTNLRCQSKRDFAFSGEGKQTPKNTILQVLGTCLACNTQIKVQLQHIENTTIYCPNCNETITFKNIKSRNTDALLKTTLTEYDLPSKELKNCKLCQEELTSNEIDNNFFHKNCRFNNPVVVLNPVTNCNTSDVIEIKEEIISPKSDDLDYSSLKSDDSFKKQESSSPKSDDSSKKDSSPKSDDSSKKKRKRTLGILSNSKYRKLSVSNSETDISLEPDEPVPFNGTYYCKLCDYNNTNREEFHKHIIQHRDVCTSYQCMECGECFVVKPSLAKHLVYYHQVTDIETYFNDNNCFDKKAVKELENVMRLAPGESKEPVAENQCRVCMQQFNDALELNKHFRIHGMAFLFKNSK